MVDSDERLVDWRGEVSVGALLREALRQVSRRPGSLVLIPGLVVLAFGGTVYAAQFGGWWFVPLAGVAAVVLWGWIAQGLADQRALGPLLRLAVIALVAVLAGGALSQRFDLGLWPFGLVMSLVIAFPVAVPAVAVDGLGQGWSASQGTRLRLWAAWAVVVLGHLVVAALLLFFLRRSASPWLLGCTFCAAVGSGLGMVMTLSSLVHIQLRNLRRSRHVSTWVEVFR